jgi:CubicO group peptidase (beta-lactamase class C family)
MVCSAHVSATASGAEANVPSADKLQLLGDFFEDEVATGKISGAVVQIQQHGRPVYQKTFGMRDVRISCPMTTDTIFALRSMTKTRLLISRSSNRALGQRAGHQIGRACGGQRYQWREL